MHLILGSEKKKHASGYGLNINRFEYFIKGGQMEEEKVGGPAWASSMSRRMKVWK